MDHTNYIGDEDLEDGPTEFLATQKLHNPNANFKFIDYSDKFSEVQKELLDYEETLNKYHTSEKWKAKEKPDAEPIWKEKTQSEKSSDEPIWKGEENLLDHEKEYKRMLYESIKFGKGRKLLEVHEEE